MMTSSSKGNNKRRSTKRGEASAPQVVVLALDTIGPRTVFSNNQTAKIEQVHQRPKVKSPSEEPISTKFVAPEPQCKLSFKKNDNIEVLCQDSGIRGCWFRCKVLKVLPNSLKVQYCDLLDDDEKLEEQVSSCKVADKDYYGMRCAGRFTVRPSPREDISDTMFVIGAAVDAWCHDGWWEGVITKCPTFQESEYEVYLPAENLLHIVERKDLRSSKDWFDNRWMDIRAQPAPNPVEKTHFRKRFLKKYNDEERIKKCCER